MASFDQAFQTVVTRDEGGFVYSNVPGDPGGETYAGVSKLAHPAVDIKSLTPEKVRDIYQREYWGGVSGNSKSGFSTLQDQDVATKMLSITVNIGPVEGIRILQEAVNSILGHKVDVDGVFGKITRFWANQCDPQLLLWELRARQALHYALVHATKDDHFILGLLRRAVR